jgi:acyl carrier protein
MDSFKFINFITALEKQFDISFDNEAFQKVEFKTINGLSEIIKSKKQQLL